MMVVAQVLILRSQFCSAQLFLEMLLLLLLLLLYLEGDERVTVTD